MNRCFRVSGCLACLLAVMLANGGHWAVLQSIAWARMLVEFSRDYPLPEAIKRTFDGRHPCRMCCRIQEGRQQEQQQPPIVKWDKQPEFVLDPRLAGAPSPPSMPSEDVPFVPSFPSDFQPAPPKPPPRAT
jgi:hypothetical protein